MFNLKVSEQRRKIFIEIGRRRCQPGSGSSLEFLNRRTWNQPVSNIKSLIKKTPFVVVGGIATRLYMPERMTDDLDILIMAEDTVMLHQELEKTGSKKVGNLSIGGSTWQLPDGTILDVIESEKLWVKEAIKNYNIAPDGLPIIGLPYLVLMKLEASRSQDLADVTRMLGGANETTLELVIKVVETYMSNVMEDLESLIMLGKLEMGE
ncbi:MAG: hypothetical protein WBA93_31250 [Microcoleaceae cyanobacterium]